MRFQIIRGPRLLELVSNFLTPKKYNLYVNGSSLHLGRKTRLYGTGGSIDLENGVDFGGKGKRGRLLRAQAQSALAEYFHFTRSFRFLDAENMSRNSPEFFDRLMKRVRVDRDDEDIKHSVTRFLRYEPVNEFEPFFESIGLKYAEFAEFLPKGLMFLADDELLLENYYVLCDYGIERDRIGKIFVEANEVFRYEHGVLGSKLLSLEDLGLNRSLVAKIVASSPQLLRGNVGEPVQFLEKLMKAGIKYDWLLEHIGEGDSCDWKSMFRLMCLFCRFGLSEEQVGEVLRQNPSLLLECSGRITFGLIGILMKFGSTTSQVRAFLHQFPRMPVSKFARNLLNSYTLLMEMTMSNQDIGRIVRSCPVLLGSVKHKKMSSLMSLLSCGRRRLCEMVKDDPFALERWARGRRVERLNTQERVVIDVASKARFLRSLGFVECSKVMEKAVRGRGEELQERLDCLVKNGVSREEVIKMLETSPQVLNQNSHVLETKIRVFFDELGYRVPDLVRHPKIIAYTTKRMKIRLLMYKWLQDEGALEQNMSLGTLLGRSDRVFIRKFVNLHARGPEFWKSLNEEIV